MNSRTSDLVIFDCDGVLVDSEPLVNRVFVGMLREAGHVLDEDACLRELTGCSLATRLEIVEPRTGFRHGEGFVDELLRRLGELVERELRPTVGVVEALERIRIPRCVASNGLPEEIEKRLRAARLLRFFPTNRFSAAQVARPKPAPDVYLFAARSMRVAPERCVVVEDSLPGVRSAIAAGMRTLAFVPLGASDAHAALGAEVFSDMRALPALLG